jgi:uncharacterized membrane protein YgaE (UPF0421/DUF939 family)
MKIGKYFIQNQTIWGLVVGIIAIIGVAFKEIQIILFALYVLFIFPLLVDCRHVPEWCQ